MANTKQKGITYTPPTKKRLPQLYKLKEKTTTRGSRSSWVKDSWARKTKSVTSSPIKSPSKHKSGSPHLLYEGADFEFDQETSLIKVGLHIHLAHDGTPCPSSTDDSSDFFQWSDTDDNIDDDYPEGPFIQPVRDSDRPAITVVDKSGVHSLSICYCQCPSALSRDIQLFQAGLFPASFTRPKTAFTFAVLDDFLLDNLECGTSAMNYYSKIRRLTSSIFPLMVPDRYRELMRAARQWRQCKLYKWHGFAHKDDQPKDGDLALFCPACPQPGINLDLSTSTVAQPDDTPSWLMTRYLVMDGNFKAEHMHPVNPSDEVSLMDGLGFMVSDERYKSHLAIAQDNVQRSDCNNHRAVNQANASRQRLEATGIGGCACARHGCFVPHSMVDFQKGERQMNMDYALSQALNYKTDGISRAITFYDINCMDIIPGIGLWHVHGHQDNCFVRYASNFIHGTGRIDGEIMETLWAPLNIISPSARGMGTPHRKEVLDYQMNDCNFMKMIRITKFLSRKFKEAIKGASESKLAFDNLNETANPDMVVLWKAEEALAHANRAEDPTAMDIYEVRLERGKCPLLLAVRLKIALNIRSSTLRSTRSRHLACNRSYHRGIANISLQGYYSDFDEDQNPDLDVHNASIFQPELTVIPLPSNIGAVRCRELGLTNLIKEEIALREVETAVNLHARIYSKCRSQLAKLPDHDLLKKYLPLKKEDLKASSAVADPNARVYRVNWLRTKALRDRWNEEVILVKHEMQWSINFFTHRAKQWLCHMHNATSAGLTGHTCYAARQSHIYDLLAAHAEDAFRKMIVGIEVPVPAAYAEDALREMIVRIEVPVPVCRSHHSLIFLSMDNTVTLIPSNQVIIAAKGNHITAADISRALFYANSRMLAMRLYVDKSFATAIPGYAETFYTLMKWEMETFATPFINICFITRLSATIPQLLKDVLSTMTAHTLVDRRPDVNAILQDIRALRLSADSNKSDDYDIAHMPDYFNDWWKESLGCCRVSDMLPKSSVQDVMDLVEWHFSHLPDHVKTGLLPYIIWCAVPPDNDRERVAGYVADKDDES
ncbi:uncharacterized protein HD556DRAFT_1303602 [Suillus plorans]|uniref:CxC2-like cysteine cluster KDZ transposase-associated domain-containing protein n=1 Tax=Suillus plorans TaxID=116603 RepID=A0A9P7J502_9AGAM|nr:uncharacterized protein HD556DRAFT_1303602 [Suillus plorans]KAG1803526.1 hypothetical protein HD556DRAFT_1303602 [Suillus plorans]